MKLRWLPLILLVFGWGAFPKGQEAKAQTNDLVPVLNWSTNYNTLERTNFSGMITRRGELTYTLRTGMTRGLRKRPRVFIEVYDDNLKLTKSREYDLRYKKKQREFEQIIPLDDKFYFLTSFTNEGKKRKYLFVQEIDGERLLLDRSLKMIGETPIQNRDRTGFFGTSFSKDSSRILVYNQLPYKRKDPEQFALRVYDRQFNSIWSKDVILPYNDQVLNISEYQVDNQGNVFLLGKRYKDGSNRDERRGNPNFEYIILAYFDQGARTDEYVLELPGQFISDLTLRLDHNGDLVCAGFFSDQSANRVKGTCFFRIDPVTKALKSKNQRPFEFKFLAEDLSDREIRRARDGREDPELYRYSLDELILRSDGGALLIAEQFYVYERAFRNWDGTLQTDYFYHYNDIIVVNIRPDGTIEWASRIPKLQETVNDRGYYSSYVHAVVRDRIYFLYNTDSRNFRTTNDRGRLYNFDSRNAEIAIAEVRRDGTVSIAPMNDQLGGRFLFRPKVSEQTKLYEITIFGEGRNQFRLGKVRFTRP